MSRKCTKVNTNKTKILIQERKWSDLERKPIEQVESLKYIGNIIEEDLRYIREVKMDF